MGKHPNPKPQTTRIQDPTKLLVGEGERGKQRSQDPQMGTSLAVQKNRTQALPALTVSRILFDESPTNGQGTGTSSSPALLSVFN